MFDSVLKKKKPTEPKGSPALFFHQHVKVSNEVLFI